MTDDLAISDNPYTSGIMSSIFGGGSNEQGGGLFETLIDRATDYAMVKELADGGAFANDAPPGVSYPSENQEPDNYQLQAAAAKRKLVMYGVGAVGFVVISALVISIARPRK